MRRDQFTVEITNHTWVETGDPPRRPTLSISFSGDPTTLDRRLRTADAEAFGAAETDVSFRFKDRPDDPEAAGVVALTDRVTGDYVLELNVVAEDVLPFITAARRYGEKTGDSARYRLRLLAVDEEVAAYEKGTLLVYSSDGELLRQHSLIPSGVEI